MKVFQHGHWCEIPDTEEERKRGGFFQNADGIWCVQIEIEIPEDVLSIECEESGELLYVRHDITEEANSLIGRIKGDKEEGT